MNIVHEFVRFASLMEPSYFAQHIYRAMETYPAKLYSDADFAPQNHRDIDSGTKQIEVEKKTI